MKYDILPHTIFITIGPSGCGKSFFCTNYLLPILKSLPPLPNRNVTSVNYISSDNIRRMLLGQEDLDKNHAGMLAASQQTFELLYKQVEVATSFPINAEFVIVDTKGTNESFRNAILDIAKTNHYNVVMIVFNYKQFDDYMRFSPMTKFVQKDIQKVRAIMSSGLKKTAPIRDYIIIKGIDFQQHMPQLTCSLHDFYRKCFVPNNQELLVISDIHGCYEEFIALLKCYDIVVKDHRIVSNPHNKLIIINGDYIDKGPKILDMIAFCYDNTCYDNTCITDACGTNTPSVLVTIGNHENRLYKELKGDLPHISEDWATTYQLLTEEYRMKFMAVFERSLPFIMNDLCIITHAPCHVRYLGKVDGKSISHQKYFMLDKSDKTLYQKLESIELFNDTFSNISYIFGHIQTLTPSNIHGKILCDGGCVTGGKLVGVEVCRNGKTYMKYVPSQQPQIDLLPIYALPTDTTTVNDNIILSDKNLQRVRDMISNKVNFLSGTMAPSDKKDGKLESIESALQLYKEYNVFDIVMQPKYMGSRANMYLFNEDERCYIITRRGFKIKQNLSFLYPIMRKILSKTYDFNEIECIILDGELLPWHVLGEALIRDCYTLYDNILAENAFLQETHFDESLQQLLIKYPTTTFTQENNHCSKKDLIAKYGNYDYQILSALHDYVHLPTNEKEALNAKYLEQLRLYGSPGDITFKAFAILKIVKKDGTECCYYLDNSDMTNERMWNVINNDKCYRYDINNEEDIQACIRQFQIFTTIDKYEGVVIKPNQLSYTAKHIPPYIKVRNQEYLSIVYGYDHTTPHKYKKLYDRKSIKGKLRLSIREWQLALKILAVPFNNINQNNEELKRLFMTFLKENTEEDKFDPRL